MAWKRYKFGWLLLVIFFAAMILPSITTKELVAWQTDYRQGLIDSKASGKPRLLYFSATWCAPCEQLSRTTWANKDVARALEDYVAIKLDFDKSPDVALNFKIDFLPAYVVVSHDSKVLFSASGYMSPEQFLAWLKFERNQLEIRTDLSAIQMNGQHGDIGRGDTADAHGLPK